LGDDICESTALIVTSGFDGFPWKLDPREGFFFKGQAFPVKGSKAEVRKKKKTTSM